jgi:microsomal dipeptidase-like Zn-dependent dipeptidase
MRKEIVNSDRVIRGPQGERGRVVPASPVGEGAVLVAVPHDDRTALHKDFGFRAGSSNKRELGKPLMPLLVGADRKSASEANKGSDGESTVLLGVNFFNQRMETHDHVAPATHDELMAQTDIHRNYWNGVVRRSDGLYTHPKTSGELFTALTTPGVIPVTLTMEGWSAVSDPLELTYDQMAKDIARRDIDQVGGWNSDSPWGKFHGSTAAMPGFTEEGQELHRALAAHGVTVFDGSHGHDEYLEGLVDLAQEPNMSHTRVLVSHAGVKMGRVSNKTRNPSERAIQKLFDTKKAFFGIANATSMLPGDDTEAVADAAEYLVSLDPTKDKRQVGMGFDNNGKGLGTTPEDQPTMLQVDRIAQALYRRPTLRPLVHRIMWQNYAEFKMDALFAREHAA